jgi:hypothetical protein
VATVIGFGRNPLLCRNEVFVVFWALRKKIAKWIGRWWRGGDKVAKKAQLTNPKHNNQLTTPTNQPTN